MRIHTWFVTYVHHMFPKDYDKIKRKIRAASIDSAKKRLPMKIETKDGTFVYNGMERSDLQDFFPRKGPEDEEEYVVSEMSC